jgi:elongation factor P
MLKTAGNIKKKDYINFKNDLWQVTATEFYHPGKGRTVMRTKLRSVSSGKGMSQVFTSNEQVDIVDITTAPVQYLYSTKDTLAFMHQETYEEYEVATDLVGKIASFFKEGQQMYVLLLDNKPIGIRPPKRVELKVIKADDAAKGDTATNAKKEVTVETGAKLLVPLFIKQGETIAINPETGDYAERVN